MGPIIIIYIPIMKPTVTSSGKRMRSPMLINFPPPAMGNMRRASARLIQNPAPPVANQKRTFGSEVFRFFCIEKSKCPQLSLII